MLDPTITATSGQASPAIRGRVLHALTRVHPRSEAPCVIDRPLDVGRAPGPDGWALDDGRTSRRHFRVSRVRSAVEAVRLDDLGSKNGTTVDGARVEMAYLEPGAVVRAGNSLFVYETLAVADDTPPLLEPGVALPRVAVQRQADLLAPLTLPVLITGPTGAGKERVARRLHAGSGRRGSLVSVNCATFGRELLASELFGHVAGAFSGARERRDGLFVTADGGTLFLDEIAEMPLSQQPALLRVLQEGRVRPVGADRERPVDVRVIAATHGDLRAAVEQGRFRGDLYARLAGAVVELPPLAARRADILPLFRHFVGADGPAPTVEAAEALARYAWPFNVRELQHAASAARVRAVLGGALDVEALPDAVRAAFTSRGAAPSVVDRAAIERALAEAGGNVSAAARALGQTRPQLYRRLKVLAIDPAAFRGR